MLNLTDFLWSYKISVSVQIYRDCNLQRKCGHLTEILPTFLKSVNGSSFPVNEGQALVSKNQRPKGRGRPYGNENGALTPKIGKVIKDSGNKKNGRNELVILASPWNRK